MQLPKELTDSIEAKIQAKIGQFLGLKSKLVKLRRVTSIDVKSQVEKLYKRQSLLENELKIALSKIENIKKGAYTMGDVIQIGAFATAMTRQIKDVNSLAAGSPMAKGLPIAWAPLTAIIGIGLGVVMMTQKKGKR